MSIITHSATAENPELHRLHIVAEVNSSEISHPELDQEVKRQLGDQLRSLDKSQQHFLYKRVLKKLIQRQLLIEAAKEKRLMPADPEVLEAVARVKSSMRTEEAFSRLLNEVNMDEEAFVEEIRDDIAIRRYLKTYVYSKVSVEESELLSAYKENTSRYSVPEEVKSRQIFFSFDTAVSSKLGKVLEEALDGKADFTKLSRQYSEGPKKGKGGNLGFVSRGQMPASIERAVFALKPGEVSEPIRSRHGVHVLKVEEKRGGEALPYEEVKEDIRQQLLAKRQREVLFRHLEELWNKAKVIVYLD